MGLELATAYVTARGDVSNVAKDLNAGRPGVESAARELQGMINGILATIGVGFSIGKIISEMREGIGLAQVQIDAEQKIAAVVEGTGMAAGFTADELKKMASEFQAATTVGDESILELQARLLTFKSITGDTFKLATEVALNTAAVMGTDARSAAIMLGRALEDPIRGVSALRRTGVSFSEQQKDYIKQLVESNRLNDAQAFILETVQGQLGDVAKAMAQTDSGKLKQAQNTLGDLKEELGKKLIPTQTEFVKLQMKMTEQLTNFVGVIQSMPTSTKELIIDITKMGVGMGALLIGVTGLTKGLGLLKVAMTAISAHPLALALTGLATVIGIAAAEWQKYNRAVEEGNTLSEKAAKNVENQIGKFEARIKALRDLEGKTFKDEGEKTEALQNIRKMEEYYGDLGIKLNETEDGFTGIAEGIEKMERANERMELGVVERQITDLTQQLQEQQKSTDKAAGRWERFGKAFKETKDLWDVPGAFGEFFKGSEDVAGNMKAINEQLEELKKKREELQEQMAKGEDDKTKGSAKMSVELAARLRKMQEAAESKRESMMSKMNEETAKLSDQLSGASNELRNFIGTGAEWPMIRNFAKALAHVEKMKKELKEKEELDSAAKKWEEALKTPIDRYKEGVAELNKLVEKDRLTEEQMVMARKQLDKKLKDELDKDKVKKVEFGRVGFADFGKQLQDMILRGKDPQKEVAINTQKIADNTAKIPEMVEAMKKPPAPTPGTYSQ